MSERFFIGWESRPMPRLMWVAAVAVVAGFLGLGALLAATADEPVSPDTAMSLPLEAPLRGVLTNAPHPVLHMAPDTMHPRGRAVLLAGEGKFGAPGDLAALEGRLVAVEGSPIQRGSIAMLAVGTPPTVLEGPAHSPVVERLGRWRIAGEICDGKCAAGAMRPGTGLSHRACATLCLQGEIPAVFVATAPVAGSAFLLLADEQGAASFDRWRDLIGLRVVLEGLVERRGDLLVFLADVDRAQVP